MWTCNNCGRTFRNANHLHSCIVVDIDSHFTRKPEAMRLVFDRLLYPVRVHKLVYYNFELPFINGHEIRCNTCLTLPFLQLLLFSGASSPIRSSNPIHREAVILIR
jgi:hypothetical protein